MNICIIGTGASGWIICSLLKKINFIKKIQIIGSSKLPPIGVGESTTLNFFENFLDELDFLREFVKKSDATVKYGVYYQNWSSKNFLHYIKSSQMFSRNGFHSEEIWGQLLANKNTHTHIHDLVGNNVWNCVHQNKILTNTKEYLHTWNFDAAKFIDFLKNKNLKEEKIELIDDIIVDCEFNSDKHIEFLIGENGQKYTADYYVNCCGDNKLNEYVFKEKYEDLSNYLLTNKAWVYPLEYTEKEKQFHPYTLAKTMKNGWRWITPTQSRIGTGYVFSDKHISVDEAADEFLNDIGDKNLEPKLVDFSPKFNKTPFKNNHCTIGMSQGFLEPLDAPGLALTVNSFNCLSEILNEKNKSNKKVDEVIQSINHNLNIEYFWWCSFILHQYKTCYRNDTKFWVDHKNVDCYFYEECINLMIESPEDYFDRFEFMMLYFTTAAKDIRWKSKFSKSPPVLKEIDSETISHLDYINSFYAM